MSRKNAKPRSAALALGLVAMLSGCGESGRGDGMIDPSGAESAAEIVPASEMLSGANVPTIDPHTMKGAEIAKAMGDGALCLFRYTRAGGPVLALDPPGTAGEGVVKLNGSLVRLAVEAGNGTIMLEDGPVAFALSPDGAVDEASKAVEATLVFAVEERLRVGYRGYYECRETPGSQA